MEGRSLIDTERYREATITERYREDKRLDIERRHFRRHSTHMLKIPASCVSSHATYVESRPFTLSKMHIERMPCFCELSVILLHVKGANFFSSAVCGRASSGKH